ncbi:MAG: pepsin/retropepsin-like aspartic protease family protein [Elusimicrobiota bacterium]
MKTAALLSCFALCFSCASGWAGPIPNASDAEFFSPLAEFSAHVRPLAQAVSLILDPNSNGIGGTMEIPCVLAGTSGSCFLDTGAGVNLIEDAAFSRGFETRYLEKIKGASGGFEIAPAVRVPSVRIGNFSFGPRTFIRLSGKNRCGSDFPNQSQAIVGMSLLSAASPFRLSFGKNPTLTLGDPLPNAAAANPLRIATENRILIPVTIATEGLTALFDTGYALSAVDQDYIKSNPDIFALIGGAQSVDATCAASSGKIYKLKSVVIGGREFHDVRVLAGDFGPLRGELGANVRMVVGYNLITRMDWTIDAKRGTWSVKRTSQDEGRQP